LTLALYAVIATGTPPSGSHPNARTLVADADAILNPSGIVRSRIRLEVDRQNEPTVIYSLEVLRQGSDLMRVNFLSPARMRGQALLRRGESQWLYFPSMQRTLKVPRRQSLAGSDFSYGDILNINLVSEYEADYLGSEKDGQGRQICHLRLKAKNLEATYDEIQYWVRCRDATPLRREYFTKSGQKLKILQYAGHDNHGMPLQWTMYSVLNPANATRIVIENISAATGVSEDVFSLSGLRQE